MLYVNYIYLNKNEKKQQTKRYDETQEARNFLVP